MSAREGPPATIRQARPADVEAILDLLTHYELPRAAFERHYYADPTYRPEHSWLVERDGRLVAHLRIYDRLLYLGGARLRVAGVGNVVTHRDARSRGYAGQLLDAVLAALPGEGYAYSLLWTHLPGYYARYGWAPIAQEQVHATLPPATQTGLARTPFTPVDLPAVMELYDAANAARTGPVVRSPAYWQGQLAWLDEDPAGFLLARTGDGRLVGYVRCRLQATAVEILELALVAEAGAVGRALLAAAATPRDGRVVAHFPPSLLPLLPAEGREATTDMGLMGRVIDLRATVQALAPLWRDHLPAAGLRESAVKVDLPAGRARLLAGSDGITVVESRGAGPAPALDERILAHLLFHGADRAAQRFLDGRADAAVLRALFPPRDFVFWPADAF